VRENIVSVSFSSVARRGKKGKEGERRGEKRRERRL